MKKKYTKLVSYVLVISCLAMFLIPEYAVRAVYYENIAQGESYTLSAYDSAHPSYTWSLGMADDENKELTDTLRANPTSYSDTAWTGYNGWANTTVTTVLFDFGREKAVKSVSLGFFNVLTAGIAPPRNLKISLSSDNSNWVTVTNETNSPKMSNTAFSHIYKARYVKIELTHANSWLILDEVMIMGSNNTTGAVAPINMSENLVAGRSYSFTAYDRANPSYTWSLGMADTNNSELTNGVYGDPQSYSDAAWTGYNGWNGTTVTTVSFDLQTIKTIDSIYSSYFTKETAGIAPPSEVVVLLSSDNVNWTTVASEKDRSNMMYLSFPQSYKARYIKIKYTHGNSWLIFDEIKVMGSSNTANIADPTNLAKNKSYNYTAYDSVYPNYAWSLGMADTNNIELTNGIKASNPDSYSDTQWMGYNGWANSTISTFKVDLLAEKAIDGILSSYYLKETAGIAPPAKVAVYLSSDNTNWTCVAIETNRTNMNWICFAQTYRARYVKVEYTHASSWLIFDEIEIIGSSALTNAVSPVTYSDTPFNLAANKSYTFTAYDVFKPSTDFIASGYYMADTNNAELTDGIYSPSANYSNTQWTGYNGWAVSTTTTIKFDFTSVKAIDGVNISYLIDSSAGINPPRKVSIFLSNDGTNWTSVYQTRPNVKTSTYLYPDSYTLPNRMKARYVKIELIHNNSYILMDEVQVMGSNLINSAVDPVTYVPDPPAQKPEQPESPRATTSVEQRFPNGANSLNGYMKPGASTAGIHDLVLLYNQYYEDGTGDYTPAKIRPYLTYVNRNGNAVDTLFDGVLFLALNSNRYIMLDDQPFYRNFADGRYPAEKVDFDWYLNKTFGTTGDMYALNEAARIARTELNNSTYKAKVVLMVPRPSKDLTSFGSIGPLSNLQNQIQALNWFMNELVTRFNAGNYQYLDLAGLYWLDESMEANDPIVNAFATYTHNQNLKTYWIPYYNASGSTTGTWRTAGMDAVAYQPNHYFVATPNPDRITVAAQQASTSGMGIEIENGPDLMKDWSSFDTALDYLDGSVLYNYQGSNAFRAHYQWVTGYQLCSNPTLSKPEYVIGTSQYERGRRFYEDTYKMVKGTLKRSNRSIVGAPTLNTATTTSISVVSTSGYEYSIDFINWTTNPVFSGLNRATNYTVYQRVAATSTHEASLASPGLVARTLN